jgi:hypothetical protein
MMLDCPLAGDAGTDESGAAVATAALFFFGDSGNLCRKARMVARQPSITSK